jgi:hypothetical protein
MFDYQHGTSTKRFKEKIQKMIPRLPLASTPNTKPLSLVFTFFTGLEILELSLVNKAWYFASWDASLWRELSKSLDSFEKTESLLIITDLKIQKFENKLKKTGNTDVNLTGTIKWKIVYIKLLYKYCKHCSLENKLRFLPVMQRTLCFKCSKLPEYAMISLENAELEYKVTKEKIAEHQLDGLRVPHTNESGKYMYVYYLSDILSINHGDIHQRKEFIRSNIEERRKTEIVYYMKKEGVDDEFINLMLETEGSHAHNYMLGKSTMTCNKISKMLANLYQKQQRKKIKDAQTQENSRKKHKNKEIVDDGKALRKIQLIERLTLMGLDTEHIRFDDKESIAYSYINGRTKKDIGIVAGAVWRENKPIFTGISSITTQRIEDIKRN